MSAKYITKQQRNARRTELRQELQDRECSPYPTRSHAKSARVDLGLAILQTIALPGVQYTFTEQAAFAGCTDSAIQQIYLNAMKKIRHLVDADPKLKAAFALQLQDRKPARRVRHANTLCYPEARMAA